MAVTRIQKKLLHRLRSNRRGTAEIVGSVMFLVILLFVFTNVYLWHDNATREMNGVLAEKMNSPVSISNVTNGLVVTNNGGFEVGLSRLWLVDDASGQHYYVDLEPFNVNVAAGTSFNLLFVEGSILFNSDGSVQTAWDVDGHIWVYYPADQKVTCKILSTLGNMAACTYAP